MLVAHIYSKANHNLSLLTLNLSVIQMLLSVLLVMLGRYNREVNACMQKDFLKEHCRLIRQLVKVSGDGSDASFRKIDASDEKVVNQYDQ